MVTVNLLLTLITQSHMHSHTACTHTHTCTHAHTARMHTHTQVEWPKPDKDNMVHMDWLVTLVTQVLASFPNLIPDLGMRHHVLFT